MKCFECYLLGLVSGSLLATAVIMVLMSWDAIKGAL